MAECKSNPGCDLSAIREAVCIHTSKVMDACRDKDCIEDLRVYLTRDSQAILDGATTVRARSAELLHVDIDVEPLAYNDGYFTVDITFYYRIVADATVGGPRPGTVCGLGVFSKRCVLCGGTGAAKIFSSIGCTGAPDRQQIARANRPIAVVEVVDPMILAARVCDVCACSCCDPLLADIPAPICECFGGELVLSGEAKRLLVTLGQFSIVRLERETQLLIPAFDYCIPTKECSASLGGTSQSPCDVFSNVEFPVDDFFPGTCRTTGTVAGTGTGTCGTGSGYRTCN